MSECRIVTGDAGSIHPASIDRKAPGETIRLEHDLSADLDCAGLGITISSSLWAIHPDDADGDLALGTPSDTGLVTQVPISGGADGSLYRVINTVTASDGQIIERTTSIPVLETRGLNA